MTKDEEGIQVLVDTGKCRVETHPDHGVVIVGLLIATMVDGKPVMVPSR